MSGYFWGEGRDGRFRRLTAGSARSDVRPELPHTCRSQHPSGPAQLGGNRSFADTRRVDRVPSSEAFGRRLFTGSTARDGPASETLYEPCRSISVLRTSGIRRISVIPAGPRAPPPGERVAVLR